MCKILISQSVPPFLPPTVSTCLLCLCVYFCPANRFICTIFLDSTYMCCYTIFVFLTDCTLYKRLWSHPHLYAAAAAAKLLQSCPTLCDPTDSSPPGFSVHISINDPISFLFSGWVTSHYMYVPRLYTFICWWTFRLLPSPGYCQQCCSERCGTCVFLNYGFLRVYAQQWDGWVIW